MPTSLLPLRAGLILARSLAVTLPVAGLACDTNTPSYFPSPAGPIEVGAMGQPGQSNARITLAFRPPTDAERSALDRKSGQAGFHVPWLSRDQVSLSLHYTITNLSNEVGKAQLLIDGASEIYSYDAAAQRAALAMMAANNDEIIVLSLINGTPVLIAPGRSISGVVREDELAEAALDLDAIGRWMAAPVSVLINSSEANRVGLEGVPAGVDIPALYDLNVSFAASKHMRLTLLVRVRDDLDRLVSAPDNKFEPQPAAIMASYMR